MVESTWVSGFLSHTIEIALASGITKTEILGMLETASRPSIWEDVEIPAMEVDHQGLPIYTELPLGLIDLPSAAKKYGLNVPTIRNWVNTGRVQRVGRLKAPATGSGYLVVSESDLQNYMAMPRNKGGRPLATSAPPAPTNGHSPHVVNENDQDLPIYAELPSGMIDLPAAAKKHGGTVGQYRNWINRGRLQPRGRLRAPVRGGGHLVVSEEDLLAYKSVAASRKGRPRKSEHP